MKFNDKVFRTTDLQVGGTFNGPRFNSGAADDWGMQHTGGGRQTMEMGNVYPGNAQLLSIKDATNTFSITAKRLTNNIAGVSLPAIVGSPDSQEDFYNTVTGMANVLAPGVTCTNVRKSPTDPRILQQVWEGFGFTDIVELSSNDSVSYTLKMQMIKSGYLEASQLLYTCLNANADVQIAGDTLYWGQPTFGGTTSAASRPVRTFDSPFQFKNNILLANGQFILSKSKFNIFLLSSDFGGGAFNQIALDYTIVDFRDNIDFK